MDRDVMTVEKPKAPYTVLVRLDSIEHCKEAMAWFVASFPDETPNFTMRYAKAGEYVLRARFVSKKNAAVFRLFWS
jgi:hypothetical protein